MKRIILISLLIPVLMFNPQDSLAQSNTVRDTALTFVLSNEGGKLIDDLIASGYGDGDLYEAVAALQAASGGVISDEFLEILADCPGSSEIFTMKLNTCAGMEGALAINTDGTVHDVSLCGKDYFQKPGYKTYPNIFIVGVGREVFTHASGTEYYIDAGSIGEITYQAFAIAWSMKAAPTTFVLSNEGGLIDYLIDAGYGSGSPYDALLTLQSSSGGVISDEFLDKLATCPAGSEIFTAKLSTFAGLNNPVCVNTDGTLTINPIFGREYFGKQGYSTYPKGGTKLFTYAISPDYYMDAGKCSGGGDACRYMAFAIAWSISPPTTFVLSNEAPGYLINNLIANRFGDKNLYEVLQALQPVSGGAIPQSYMNLLAACPPESEVFTAHLSSFGGSNNPICINSNGTLKIKPIFGRDFFGKEGYTTGNASESRVNLKLFTYATNPEYYIDAGYNTDGSRYQAFAIAWSLGSTFILSNEAPGYLIDNLITNGYGNKNLFQVLQALQPASGGVIPEDFMSQLSACPTGSEIFTPALINFAGLNNPVGINADGTLNIVSIFGIDYYGKEGYSTYPEQGGELFTYAIGPSDYIDTGMGAPGGYAYYNVFAIAWSNSTNGIPVAATGTGTPYAYPNPFTDGFYVENLKNPARIEVYNVLGELLVQTRTEGNGFIGLNTLPNGVYWLKITADASVTQQKMVKHR